MEWSEDSKGRIIMIAKEDLRKTLGRSPDRCDAVVIALFESANRSRDWRPAAGEVVNPF